MTNETPNYLRIAVETAGGVLPVCEALGLNHYALRRYIRLSKLPAHLVRPLCNMSTLISVDLLLQYLEEAEQAREEHHAHD